MREVVMVIMELSEFDHGPSWHELNVAAKRTERAALRAANLEVVRFV
jgi:hypothetical protein